MRRPARQPEVGFGARLPRTDKLAFDAACPQQGGKVWAVEVMLTHFLDLVESDDRLRNWCHSEIERANSEEPPRDLVEFLPKMPRGLYDRFNRICPHHGATSWFLRGVIGEFTRTVAEYPPPEYLPKLAVHKLLRLTNGPEF